MLRRNGYAGGLFWEVETRYTITDADYALIENWFYGTTYTYYNSGLLESKTMSISDEYGNLYYHYLDEDFNGQGYGRTDKQVLASPDTMGAIAYQYGYYPGTELV